MPARYTFINEDQVVRMLRAEVKRAGGQSEWARRNKVERTVLNRVLSGLQPDREHPLRFRKDRREAVFLFAGLVTGSRRAIRTRRRSSA
jgi:hypothetical protein